MMRGSAAKFRVIELQDEFANIESQDLSMQWIEMVYREHDVVKDIVIFNDQLGQLVALVVSEAASEVSVRCVLEAIRGRRMPDCAPVADFVVLQPNDPLVASLFTSGGLPRRALIWQFLVGSIETLTMAGDRLTPTGQRQSRM